MPIPLVLGQVPGRDGRTDFLSPILADQFAVIEKSVKVVYLA